MRRLVRVPKSEGTLDSGSPTVADTVPWNVPEWIERGSVFLPEGLTRPLILLVPWILAGGGVETYLRMLVPELASRGHTVVLITTEAVPEGCVDGVLEFDDVTEFLYPMPQFLERGDFGAFFESVLGRLNGPAVVNFGSPWFYERIGQPRTARWHGAQVSDMLFNPVGHLPAFLKYQDHFDSVGCAYMGLAALLASYYRVRVPVHCAYVPAPNVQRAQLFTTRNVRIGWLGRLSTEKQPEMFLRLARRSQLDAEFVMGGDGPLRQEIERQGSAIDRFSYAGTVRSAAEFLSDLDVLVNTSAVEGISVTAMEAVRLGVPVIGPMIGGMAEFIHDGVNGHLEQPENLEAAIGVRLDELVSRRESLDQLRSTTASAGVPSEFELEQCVASFLEIVRPQVGASSSTSRGAFD